MRGKNRRSSPLATLLALILVAGMMLTGANSALAQGGGLLDGSFGAALALRRVPVSDIEGESGAALLLTPDGAIATLAENPRQLHLLGWRAAGGLLFLQGTPGGPVEIVLHDPGTGGQTVLAAGLPAERHYALTPDGTRVLSWPAGAEAALTDVQVYDAQTMAPRATHRLDSAGLTGAALAGLTGDLAIFFGVQPADALVGVNLVSGVAQGPVDVLAAGDGAEAITGAVLRPGGPLIVIGRMTAKALPALHTLTLAADGWPASIPGEPRPLAAATMHDSPGHVQHVVWSPDGATLAVVNAVPGDFSASNIVLASADLSGYSAPVRAAFNSCALFTPDGRWLLFVGADGSSLLAVPTANPAAEPRPLLSDSPLLDLCEAAWQPAPTGGEVSPTPAAQPEALTAGSTVVGTLNAGQPALDYPLSLAAGETVTITMERMSGDLDPLLVLLDPEGVELARNDDAVPQAGDSDLNAQIAGFSAPRSGTYTVRATRFFEQEGLTGGDFRLSVIAGTPTPAATPIPAVEVMPIAVGEALTGALDNTRYAASYALTLQAGQTIAISMERLSGDLDPYLLLYGPDGAEVAANDDAVVPFGGIPVNARIDRFTAPISGQYTIQATRFGVENGASSGEYRLSVTESQAALAPGAGTLRVGDTVEDAITDARPVIEYTIQLEAGQTITVTMEALDGVLDPYLVLLDASGRELANNDDAATQVGTSTYNAQIAGFSAPTDGFYTIRATRFGETVGTTTGPYRLSVSAGGPAGGPPPATQVVDGGTLAVGTKVSGEIGGDTYAVDYTIVLNAGQTIAVTMEAESGDLDPMIVIYDPAGGLAAYNDDAVSPVGGNRFNAQITGYTAPTGGAYIIRATRFNMDTGTTSGTFVISVAPGRPVSAANGGPITLGQTVTGELTATTFAVDYTITLAAGEPITVTLIALDNRLDPTLVIRDSFGNEVAYNDDAEPQVGDSEYNAQIVGYTPRLAGQYTIRATRFLQEGGTSIGRFELRVERGGAEGGGVTK